MGAALDWGTLAASSLVIGAIIAIVFKIGLRTIGLVTAFGGGVLINAVTFDLVEAAYESPAVTDRLSPASSSAASSTRRRLADRSSRRQEPQGRRRWASGRLPLAIVLGADWTESPSQW